MRDESNGIDLTPRIDDFGEYTSFEIRINTVLVKEEYIKDFQVNYGKEVKGYLSFIDNTGVLELSPLTLGAIQVVLTDSLGSKITRKYIITEVKSVRPGNNSITIDIEFEDPDTFKLKTAYISRSFKNKTMLEIIEDVFNNDLKIEAEFNNKTEGYKYEYFVTPANMNFYEFLIKQEEISDFKFFTDRGGFVFAPRDAFNFPKLSDLKEEVFNFMQEKPYWRILEYKGIISNVKDIRSCVDGLVSNPDVEDLKYDPLKITLKDIYEEQKLNGSTGLKDQAIPDIIKFKGKKQGNHIFATPIKGYDKDLRDVISNTQEISIVVQGVLSVRMYGKILLNLPRVTFFGDKNPASVFSGKFVVVGVVDKILSGKYFQVLKLKSSDWSKFKE